MAPCSERDLWGGGGVSRGVMGGRVARDLLGLVNGEWVPEVTAYWDHYMVPEVTAESPRGPRSMTLR